jgi:hypothetical protein
MEETHEPLYLLFKLAGGSPFIIAEVLSESQIELKVKSPLVFSFQDAGDGDVYVNASKFMHFAEDDEVVFHKNNIYAVATPKQKLIRYYIEWRKNLPVKAFNQLEDSMLSYAKDPSAESLDDSPSDLSSLVPPSKLIN